MASRRTTRLATNRTTGAQGNENDITATNTSKVAFPATKVLATKTTTTTSTIATTRPRLALGSRTTSALGVKSSNIATTSAAVPLATRKRNVLHETTNGVAGPSTKPSTATTTTARGPSTAASRAASSTAKTVANASSSTTAPRRYGTRSSTGGLTEPLVESDDAVMEDVALAPVVPPPAQEARAIRPIRKSAVKTTTTASKASRVVAPSSAEQIRARRIAAEAMAKRAAEELEDARRAEEEHRSKKLRTSEPDVWEQDEPEEEVDDEEDDAEAVAEDRRVFGGEVMAKDEGWEDLDEGDEDDPLMVSTYVVEVYQYLRKLELTTLPNPDYIQSQNDVTWKMRGILIDWLIEIHTKFRLLPETIFLAINIIDRVMSTNVVSLVKLQLVGITSLFIASKYEEVSCPSVTNFHYVTDEGYEDDEILRAERYVLGMLDFNLSYPNPINFLRRISKADGYDIHSRTMAKYFMEISIVDHKFIATPPSMIAAAGSWLARRILNRGEWTPNLVHYSGYSEEELKPTAQLMLDYIVRNSSLANLESAISNPLRPGFKPDEPEHPNFVKKYAARKFFKASVSVRKWAEETYAPVQRRNPVTRKLQLYPTPAIL